MNEFYPEIILSGKKFSPRYLKERYNLNIEHENEVGEFNPHLRRTYSIGYGILRPKTGKTDISVISELLDDYMKIINDNSLLIEDRQFHIYVETTQGNLSLNSDILQKVSMLFSSLELTVVER